MPLRDYVVMPATINNSASGEVGSVIRFVNARGHNCAHVYGKLCET